MTTIRGFAVLALLWTVAGSAAANPGPNTCLDCHRKETEARLVKPTVNFASDIHAVRGLGCVACHGGDATDSDITAMDPDKGFIGKPKRSEIAEVCAKCHSNPAYMKRFNPQPYIFSLAEFRTSVHCKKISEGDTKVATCTNCHGVHGILPHNDPASPVYPTNVPYTCGNCHNAEYMKGRKVPTNQFTLFKVSVHGRALLDKKDTSAPACNDCHGNHGAVPPNTRDISMVCGHCHGREGEVCDASPLRDMMTHQGRRGCVTCHSNHGVQRATDAMLDTGPAGVCGACHEHGSKGEQAAARIIPAFHRLRAQVAEADSLLSNAEQLGMPTESARGVLKEAADQVVNARVTLHSFDAKQIEQVLDDGAVAANRAASAGERALKDWRARRVGMVLSLIVILITIGLLYLKIRDLEGPGEPAVGKPAP